MLVRIEETTLDVQDGGNYTCWSELRKLHILVRIEETTRDVQD